MTTEHSIYNSENKQLRSTILNTEPTVKLSKGNLRKFGTIGEESLPEDVLNELYKKSKKLAEEDKIRIEDESQFYIACYDPELKKIFFSEFTTEKLVTDIGFKIPSEIEEKVNKLFANLNQRWENILELTKLEKEFYLSDKSKKYFSRPFVSKFLHPEKLELNNFNSTYPLPAAFKYYGHINVNISIYQNVNEKLSKENFVITKKVAFYAVVDTIIRECLLQILTKLSSDNLEEELKGFEEELKDKNNKYVLKLIGFDDYMYGDYPICTYESVRKLVREYEPVNLILIKYPKDGMYLQPDVSHFPPIIYVPPRKEHNYSILFHRYLELYVFPENSNINYDYKDPMIFRYIPDPTQHEFYFKVNNTRQEKLLKYGESGECDFPFYINLKGIKNIFSIKKHIDTKAYHDLEMNLPYFNHISSLESKKKKKNFFGKMVEKFCAFCESKKEKEKVENEEDNHEKQKHSLSKKYKKSLKFQKKLNPLRIETKKFVNKKTNTLFNIFNYSDMLKARLKDLQTNLSKVNKKEEKLKQSENFTMSNYFLSFLPCFLKIEVKLFYGAYLIQKLRTRPFVISNDLNINEKLNFNQLLISHVPRETRISINILAYDIYLQKKLKLGSASTAIYEENGIMASGIIKMYIWPLFNSDPRVVCCFPYHGKYYTHEKENFNDSNYCILYLELPKFVQPVAHVLKTPQSYRDFLSIKYPNEKINKTQEIRKLYVNSLEQLDEIIENLKNRDQYFLKLEKKKKEMGDDYKLPIVGELKDDESPLINKDECNIWQALEISLDEVRKCLSKDPLSELTKKEKEYILYSRDYICTIPSTLEIFLRCINWLNPLHVNMARIYIKKWAKITPEDAVGLLDARFPDTFVREYAISILRECPDDIIDLYMLQLCQCLIYETNLVSPLSDFLLEKSITNPKLIGNSFVWNSIVNIKNRLFQEKLSVYLTQLFMICGNNFFDSVMSSYEKTKMMRELSLKLKDANKRAVEKDTAKKEYLKKFLKERMKEYESKGFQNFTFPIHQSYKCTVCVPEKFIIFSSKMVPYKLHCKSSDGTEFGIIFKFGDDLRQDVLTLQMLKIMDKLWLDNDLDLKITAYKVQPTGLKEGLIEFCRAHSVSALQQKEGVGGALDRELILKFLRQTSSNTKNNYNSEHQHENFVRSLAGFCVATCVLGIGDRHPDNVMVKDNGIFFHIDYGHILGNFKYKFGIKRERAPFLLTHEFVHVYTKTGREEHFKMYCVQALNILRKNANRLINLFIIMSSAGLPELNCIEDIEYLKKMLFLNKKNDEDAGNHFLGLINESKNEKFRILDNVIHNIKHG